jgi:hypothetical protein
VVETMNTSPSPSEEKRDDDVLLSSVPAEPIIHEEQSTLPPVS